MDSSDFSGGAVAPRLTADFGLRRAGFDLNVQLEVGAEIVVLFGPSGSGKTTTLQVLAGLLTPDQGRIVLDGRTLFDNSRGTGTISIPAHRRRVGYVFQQYALFPHLTAYENVGFPLHRSQRRLRVGELLERMKLTHLAGRYPHELSGGQQQRVAIARALASTPQVLLLDEPFSALDMAVRQHLQHDLLALQRDLGLPVVYVTHRLDDAFAVGQRLAIMHDGRLEQVGPIAEVFRYPSSVKVAEIMGFTNVFQAQVVAAQTGGLFLNWDGLHLVTAPQEVPVGQQVAAHIRPEDIKVVYPGRPVADAVRDNLVTGRIVSRRTYPGGHVLYIALTNHHTVEVRHATYSYAALSLNVGDQVQLALRRDAFVVISR